MGKMSLCGRVCLAVVLCLIMAEFAAAAGTAKCQAALDKKNKAWTAYEQADKEFQDSLEPLAKAMDYLDKAEAACKAADKAVQASKAYYDAADKQWVDCIENSVPKDCSAQARAMRAAKSQWDKAVETAWEAFAEFLRASNAVKSAKEKEHAAYQKLKQARDAYDAAAEAYSGCLHGRSVGA